MADDLTFEGKIKLELVNSGTGPVFVDEITFGDLKRTTHRAVHVFNSCAPGDATPPNDAGSDCVNLVNKDCETIQLVILRPAKVQFKVRKRDAKGNPEKDGDKDVWELGKWEEMTAFKPSRDVLRDMLSFKRTPTTPPSTKTSETAIQFGRPLYFFDGTVDSLAPKGESPTRLSFELKADKYFDRDGKVLTVVSTAVPDDAEK